MFAPIRNERGNWSLIGLLVGVAVMMLLVYVLVLPKLNTTDRAMKEGGLANQKRGETIYGKAIDKGKETECASNLRQIRQMIQYEKTQMSETGQLPATLDEMKISRSIQTCPISKQPYVYNPTTGEVHCATPGHEKL